MINVLEDQGGRPADEDEHSVQMSLYENYDYVSIFDGHGGGQVSLFLKFHLKDYVKKHLALKKSPVKALKDAFQDAHDSMSPESCYMTGSAVVVILKKGNKIWVANCGDSRAIMSRNNELVALSEDHKPNRESEFRRITQLGGMVTFNPNDVPRVQGNLALSRSIGDKYLHPYVIPDPDVEEFDVTGCDYIVMATDGLFDALSSIDVKNSIDNTIKLHSKKKPKTIMHHCTTKLLKEARERNSQDNTTILFWLLDV